MGARAEPQVIRVEAVKFEFRPDKIEVKAGVPVVLEITATEVEMGFSAPGLGLQADLPPGKPVRVAFTPAKAGDFEFACDVFCGSGHEDMGGVIKVLA
jgi:cytochrome c oxidase subunit II